MQKRILSVTHPSPLFFHLIFFFLGKLSPAQIKAGYAALKDIETFIKTNNFNAAFIEANNSYYTRSKPPFLLHSQSLNLSFSST
jgi:hypothetical protein